LRRLQRIVHAVESDCQEERLLVMPIDKRDRLAREGVGEVFFLLDDLRAAHDRIGRVGSGIDVGMGAAEEAEELLEAALQGM